MWDRILTVISWLIISRQLPEVLHTSLSSGQHLLQATAKALGILIKVIVQIQRVMVVVEAVVSSDLGRI